jgi:NAD(P)-dependent dehydrogenase (short-subunit alcohol dehydrogenase family)
MKNDSTKVILITGASSGIGKSTAIKLLNEGHIVYGAARRLNRMDDIKELGARTISMDVTNDKSMVEGIDKIISETSRIDILVNNAGYGSFGAIEDVDMAEAKRQFEVNVFGAARLIQLVLPYMRKHEYGRIINISSVYGRLVAPLGGWYHATKFAIEALSDTLRVETEPFKDIDVVIVEPGSIDSEWTRIAVQSVLEKSGKTDYAQLANNTAAFLSEKSKLASPPTLIAQVISEAINAEKPQTRYVAGKYAKPLLFLKSILSDRMYDKVITSEINKYTDAAQQLAVNSQNI